MAMKTSREGLIEIAAHEGIVTSPYRDSVGVWTVGIGHTANAGSPNPEIARREYTIAEIMEVFARDIAKFEERVNWAFKVKLRQHEFDAAVSFDFNTGRIHNASWVKDINAGNRTAAKKAFMRWKRPPEIIPRRQKECDLFFGGTYSSGGRANAYPASASGRVIWSKGKRVDVGGLMDSAVVPPARPPTVPIPKPRPNHAGKADIAADGPERRIGGIRVGVYRFCRRTHPQTHEEIMSKYLKYKSLTWWAAFVPLACGLTMALTEAVSGLEPVAAVMRAAYGPDMSPSMLINLGLAGIGIRGALK